MVAADGSAPEPDANRHLLLPLAVSSSSSWPLADPSPPPSFPNFGDEIQVWLKRVSFRGAFDNESTHKKGNEKQMERGLKPKRERGLARGLRMRSVIPPLKAF